MKENAYTRESRKIGILTTQYFIDMSVKQAKSIENIGFYRTPQKYMSKVQN